MPLPVGPNRASSSPGRRSRDISLTTGSPPNAFDILRHSITEIIGSTPKSPMSETADMMPRLLSVNGKVNLVDRRLIGASILSALPTLVAGGLIWRGTLYLDLVWDNHFELRIALEALYLPDSDREMSFRLATRGAWHLGADSSERRKHQRTLKDAYDRGSEAVHTGAIKGTEANRQLLTAAQELCRKGILKRMEQAELSSRKEREYWNQLMLGIETKSDA